MLLKIICILSCLLTFLSTVSLFLYKRQVKSICRQICFLNDNNSNIEITKDINSNEICELVDTLNEMLTIFRDERVKMKEKDAKLKEIITNISHDIRTPLTSLNGYFDLLGQADDHEEYQRYTGIMKERIECLKEMLEQLFTYVKLQNDEYQFEYEEFDACKELCSILVGFYEEFHIRGIKPQIEVPDEAVFMNLNKLAFRRIFENIIKNSIEHGKRYFEIRLVRQPGGSDIQKGKAEEHHKIKIVVKNDISQELNNGEAIDIDRVFERFYKADRSRNRNSTGLGLYIARDMVLKMQGNIMAEQEGELFVITTVL